MAGFFQGEERGPLLIYNSQFPIYKYMSEARKIEFIPGTNYGIEEIK